MPTYITSASTNVYATATDLEAHDLAGLVTSLALTPTRVDAILARAERDIDRVLGPLPRNATTGLKLNPATDLAVHEQRALARAVSEQALWLLRGSLLDVTPERAVTHISGPDFATDYDTPTAGATTERPLAPGVARELEPLARLRPTGARARA